MGFGTAGSFDDGRGGAADAWLAGPEWADVRCPGVAGFTDEVMVWQLTAA